MAGWGRTIGACFAAAMVAALSAGVALFLALIVSAQIANPGVGFEGPVGQQLMGVVGLSELLVIGSLLVGFIPALCGAFVILLPAHLVLARMALTRRRWYLAAGLAAGLATVLLLHSYFDSLGALVGMKGITPLMGLAALGGPVGALAFRSIVEAGRSKAAPALEK